MYQCAELLDLETEVSQEVITPRGVLEGAVDVPYFEALSIHGVLEGDVLEEITEASVAGFVYQPGLYVNLEMGIADAPLFGKIIKIYVYENNLVFIITEDFQGVYDERFGAFLIERINDSPIRALLASNLIDRPMTAWTADSKSFYLSPRRTLAERLVQAEDD